MNTEKNTDQEPEFRENPEAGTNKILSEQKAVNTQPVDSVGGAKPEPEERPMFIERKVEGNAIQLSTGELMRAKDVSVLIQTNVFAEMDYIGKQCGHCAHFDLRMGQEEMIRIQHRGSPEERKMFAELRAQLLETGVVDAAGDFVGHSQIFHDETLSFIYQMGACRAASALKNETQFLHPSQEGCPSHFADGEEWSWMYVPKDSDVAKRDQLIRDSLMKTATVK